MRSFLAVASLVLGLGLALAPAASAYDHTVRGCEIKANASCPGADLSGANLEEAPLSNANLKGANLRDAKLHKAHLSGADLTSANLIGAQLTQVTAKGTLFSHADLGNANLRGGTFTGAHFRHAILGNADFGSADLTNAGFVDARFSGTKFANATIKGTDVIPSNIDHDHTARGFFFFRVYSHVNAYGSHGDCTTGSSTRCDGVNDDGNARQPFDKNVSFSWGAFENRTDQFHLYIGQLGSLLTLNGRTNSNLGDFYVDQVKETHVYYGNAGPTENAAPRGHPGGPIALGIEWHSGFNPGYSVNVSGWLPRMKHAATS